MGSSYFRDMRLFIHEYTCGGALAATAGAESLRAEGWAMLSALVHDFANLPGIMVSTILEPGRELGPQVRCRHVGPAEEETAFRATARAADLTLVIAPETGGILRQRHDWVVEVGGRWLGCTAEAIDLTADKWALGHHLTARGVPTPDCHPVGRASQPVPAPDGLGSPSYFPTYQSKSDGRPPPPVSFPAVLKPRCGAGSQATMLLRTPAELPGALQRVLAEQYDEEMILQPFVPGKAVSVAFLIGPNDCVPLAPAEQHLSTDGRFQYQGGSVPLPGALAERALMIARRAVAAVAGLAGYVGVDLVLGSAADGSDDRVIEINPRLTTSYVGLRALAEDNLAEALLRVWLGEDLPAIRWRQDRVHFQV